MTIQLEMKDSRPFTPMLWHADPDRWHIAVDGSRVVTVENGVAFSIGLRANGEPQGLIDCQMDVRCDPLVFAGVVGWSRVGDEKLDRLPIRVGEKIDVPNLPFTILGLAALAQATTQ